MATAQFVDEKSRGWRYAFRVRERLSDLNEVLTLDDRKSRPHPLDSLSRVHVTGVGLLALTCLTAVSSRTSASDARPDQMVSYPSSALSTSLPALQTGEVRALQLEEDDSARDHTSNAERSSAWRCGLIVPSSLRAVVAAGWEHSATFRKQCQRLVEARAIVILGAFTLPKARLAEARISVCADGRVVARVEVPLNARTLELVAHELEHVLEQVDGVNLAIQAALSRSLTSPSGIVVRLPGGEFETRRAIEAGLRVAAEFHSATARRR